MLVQLTKDKHEHNWRSTNQAIGQWCPNRGPRSNFHWKENLTVQSFKIIFIEIINSVACEGFLKDKCGP